MKKLWLHVFAEEKKQVGYCKSYLSRDPFRKGFPEIKLGDGETKFNWIVKGATFDKGEKTFNKCQQKTI